ncbi:DUF5361 domain-containing protein [Citricoccus sp. K5]|uniref:DUF5361 domain-containing protein n=1 Tax=Citricoccus sp. K5 TaxID=2653135 RepID=UPI0012F37B99|nr:conserved hypothetical protein [Citricoccus sp. K5]
MTAGWTLEDVPRRLSWPALHAFVTHLKPDSALGWLVDPQAALWVSGANATSLLASIGHRLDILAWQPTKNGQKGRKPPEPWETPWVKSKKRRTIGAGPIPASEWEAFWDGGK